MIERLSRNNVAEMALVEELCFGSMAWNEPMLAELFNFPSNYAYGCFLGDRLIGYYSYQKSFDEGHISNVAVIPEFQRKGYATRMLLHMINSGPLNGVNSFTLEVEVENVPALCLYGKYGFEIEGVRENYYGKGRHAFVMWKR